MRDGCHSKAGGSFALFPHATRVRIGKKSGPGGSRFHPAPYVGINLNTNRVSPGFGDNNQSLSRPAQEVLLTCAVWS